MKFFAILLLLISTLSYARYPHKTIKIAIIDSGLDITDTRFSAHICPTGHEDFTNTGLNDTNSHGTNIAGIIEDNAGDGDYCFLIYKYYGENVPGVVNMNNEIWAIRRAIQNHAVLINISGGGPVFDEKEYIIIRNHPKVTFVVAAGNNNEDIDLSDNKFYPASLFLKNMVVVGSLNSDGVKSSFSNWSKKSMAWEVGEGVVSTVPNGTTDLVSGTSEACAIRTGKIVRSILNGR